MIAGSKPGEFKKGLCRGIPVALLVTVFLVMVVDLYGDVLDLRNGQQIEGKVIGQSRTSVRIRTTEGVKVIPKATIRRLRYGATLDNDVKKKQAAAKRAAADRKMRLALLRKQAEEKSRVVAAYRATRAKSAQSSAQSSTQKPARPQATPPIEAPREPRFQKENPLAPSATDWLDFALPGRAQLQGDAPWRGRLLAGSAVLGLGAAFALEFQHTGLNASYSRIDQSLTLAALAGQGGGAVDLLLSRQRDLVAAEINRVRHLQNNSIALLGIAYLGNSIDLLVFDVGEPADLRFHWHTDRASLAFEIRF